MKRGPQKCSKCGEQGHNAMTCGQGGAMPKPAAKPAKKSARPPRSDTVSVSPDEIVVRVRLVVSIETA